MKSTTLQPATNKLLSHTYRSREISLHFDLELWLSFGCLVIMLQELIDLLDSERRDLPIRRGYLIELRNLDLLGLVVYEVNAIIIKQLLINCRVSIFEGGDGVK